jgi:hypothetical protein
LFVTNSVTQDYKYETDIKTIIYTNSKEQAMGATMAAMKSILEHSPNTGDIMLHKRQQDSNEGIYNASLCKDV